MAANLINFSNLQKLLDAARTPSAPRRTSATHSLRSTSSTSGSSASRPARTASNSGFATSVTSAANTSNLANAPAIGRTATGMATEAAGALNPVASSEFYKALGNAFPGYQEMFGQMQGNTMDMLQGRVPSDVADMIRMYSAEQGQQGALASTARNLGLTSLDMATQGHQQGMDLFGLAKNNLTAPTYDVFGAADSIRSQLLAAGLITPAQVGQLELEMNSQRIQQQDADRMYNLQREKMNMEASQFNAEMSWARELSALNRSWEQMVFNTQKGLYQDAANARRSEQATLMDAFSNVSSILQADQPSGGKTFYGKDYVKKPATTGATSKPYVNTRTPTGSITTPGGTFTLDQLKNPSGNTVLSAKDFKDMFPNQ